jgi:adenosylmethionine---8-amino-7-oxononanoate aminotransferase
MPTLAQLDKQYVWHPFTQMRDWLKREPIVIVEGRGAVLRDTRGREYLDANSSIWTNLHGHNHPRINAAIRGQLKKIAHSSALGLANEPAALLAQRLIESANPFALGTKNRATSPSSGSALQPLLAKVFYSDDGSTATETALKLAYEYARRTGRSQAPRFLSLGGAYHGDTVGAVSLGHIGLFHKSYAGLLFKTDRVMAPYCYRCPFNRARPERADARVYRKCAWECIGQVEKSFRKASQRAGGYAALVVEPLIQGAAGMIPQPSGWLRQAAAIARAHGTLVIADEVMTGCGRASLPGAMTADQGLLASHREDVQPDLAALAKGLTGGYLPLAATLTSQAVFDVFLGDYAEFKTFFHGHSYTANQLGVSAALASLKLLQSPASLHQRQRLEIALTEELAGLWQLPQVGDIRQVGLITGVELVEDWRTRKPFPLQKQAGILVCEAMARRGVLTRPVGNVIVLMPPYCTSETQARQIVESLAAAIREVFGNRRGAKR